VTHKWRRPAHIQFQTKARASHHETFLNHISE
jgi:hypothetical protein